MFKQIKQSVLSALIFSGTVILSFVGFAAYTNLPHQSNNDTLDANIWNNLIDKVNTIGADQQFYGFSAYQSTAQSLTANTNTRINFQTSDWNTNGAYSTTNSRFQPTKAGYYQVETSTAVSTTNCGITLRIFKNGIVERTIADGGALTTQAMHGSAQVYLNGTTDYIEIYGRVNVGQSLSASRYNTYFQASYLGN